MLKHGDVTERIVQAFYHVHNKLGHGFLEKVYENALGIELRRRGLDARQQFRIQVMYDGEPVGDYFADLFVQGCVIVELKAADALVDEHHAQLINYLKATEVEVGLLLNFGPKPDVKRKVFETARSK